MKERYRHRRGSWYANIINLTVRLILLVILVIVALAVYEFLLDNIIRYRRASHWWAFLALWLFTAYLVLPRVNRFLSKIYLPGYYIGRARTGDGLLGDPINLAVRGTELQLIAAMEKAGWIQADPLNFRTSVKMAFASVLGKNYHTAPMTTLRLFGNPQDLAFQRPVGNNPRKRHHVRFWKTPKGWWLPGGYQVDWLGAATFDKHVGLALYTGQITHKIDGDIDVERDYVVDTLTSAKATKHVQVVEHFSSSFHTRNGGGDRIHTDGALPFIDL